MNFTKELTLINKKISQLSKELVSTATYTAEAISTVTERSLILQLRQAEIIIRYQEILIDIFSEDDNKVAKIKKLVSENFGDIEKLKTEKDLCKENLKLFKSSDHNIEDFN